ANLVAQLTPFISQCSNSDTHLDRHQHSLKRWVLYRHRIIEDHHDGVACILFEGAAVLDDDFTNGRMVVAEQGDNVFGVRTFSEPGEATQIAKKCGNLPAVALQLLLRSRRN